MSVQLGTRKGTVRGKEIILKEFAKYFEGEYDIYEYAAGLSTDYF